MISDEIKTFFNNYSTSGEDDEFQIYYIQREKNGKYDFSFNTYYFQMDTELYSHLSNAYMEKMKAIISNRPVNDFDVVCSEDGCIEKIKSNKVNNLNSIEELLNPIDAIKASDTNFNLEDIWGYGIVFKNKNNKRLTLFRKYYNYKSLNKSKMLCLTNGNITLVKDELLSLDLKIDSFEYQGTTYILNRYYFHQFFSFRESYIKYVEENLNKLEEEDVIENFDNFSTRCLESNNLIKKLVNIIEEDRLKWLKKNILSAEDVVNEYNLKVKINDNKIVYSDKECNISDVMKLISGCCVKDAVDMRKYIARGIREVS